MTAVLNIGRMGPGSQHYYLRAVGDGLDDGAIEDYYLDRGEAPGRWLGAGSLGLSLEGQVEGEGLSAILAGTDPVSGKQLASHPARRVPGFDLTFRAPKSVSLLWGLSDPDVAAQVQAAHEVAVAEAVGYLERTAGWTRRGAGGTEAVKTTGFVAAAFPHRTSRANDPLLHTHVLVANLGQAVDDGVWRTLDSRRLYAHAKTAGMLYQAQLRSELTVRLGVAWGPVANGCADLAAVDRPWIEAFSRRRTQILQRLDERGETSARAAQVATLETRTAKQRQASEAELRAFWARRADQLGIDPDWWRHALNQTVPQPPQVAALYRELVGDEALTEHDSTFALRDAIQAVAERLPTGAPVADVEQIAQTLVDYDPEQVLALGPTRGRLRTVDTIRRTDGMVVPADQDEPRYTTRGLLLTEQRAVNHALARTSDRLAVVADPALPDGLTAEQHTMVRRLTTSGAGVEVVVGKAGTGKTYTLDAARQLWQQHGIAVSGAALAARAALELQDSAGIPSTTLASLLARLDDHPGSPLAPGSVLVVDEASMVGTRQLARLLDHAETQRVKVVLVGDPRQLPEIDAGGLFTALATRLDAIELADNRRQREAWEQTALDQLRHGHVPDAIAAYQAHRRLVTHTDAHTLREQLVNDWWHTHQAGGGSTVMVALRRSEVDDLNLRARARLAATGRLTGPELDIDGVVFQAGDQIVCLRNDRRLGLVNGTRATVLSVDPDARTLTVDAGGGRKLELPTRYLDAGHVMHGYAITGHKAQGLTVDHTLVLGSDALYREWGYVALSRGRITNRLYTHPATPPDDLDLHDHRVQVADPVVSLTARLERSRAQQPVSQPPGARLHQLTAFLTSVKVREQARVASLYGHARQTRTWTAQRLDQTVRDLDRLGRTLTLKARRRRTELEEQLTRFTGEIAELDRRLHQLDQQLSALPARSQIDAALAEQRQLERHLDREVDRRLRAALKHPPDYLTRTLGPIPTTPNERDNWRRAAKTIERYRTRWNTTDPARPLGPHPHDPAQQRDQTYAARELDHHRTAERGAARSRSLRLAR